MNIKPLPPNGTINTIKETSDEQRPGTERQGSKPGRARKPKADETTLEDAVVSAEAEDEAVRASQLVDSQTVVKLLQKNTPQLGKTNAKFPTPKPSHARPATAKKLDRNA